MAGRPRSPEVGFPTYRTAIPLLGRSRLVHRVGGSGSRQSRQSRRPELPAARTGRGPAVTSADNPASLVDRRSVLGKVVVVLDAFTVEDDELNLAELGKRTLLAKSTLHRVVNDLVAVRLLVRSGTAYRLSGHVFELGMRASVERRLLEVATPFMEELYERTHETVHLGVLDGHDVVYVSKIGGHSQATSPSRTGGRMPLHCTAIGKALLAFSAPTLLSEVLAAGLERRTARTITAPGRLRQQLKLVAETGIAMENEESAVGIVCVASAVLDTEGSPVGAISVTGPVTRFRPLAHASTVRATATGLGAAWAGMNVRPRAESCGATSR